MKFKDACKLNEMPYINYFDKPFDLEIEKYNNQPNKFLEFLEEILAGKEKKDKYGSVIRLLGLIKNSFIDNMVRDSLLIQWLNQKKLYSSFLSLINRYRIKE
jgi:hypothetical protein